VVTDPDVTVDADAGYFTDKNGAKIPMSDFLSASALDEETGDWDIDVLPVYPPSEPIPPQIVSIGTSPLGGGAGSFTTTFVVPEPTTWAMMLMGFAGLAFAGFRSQKRAAAPAV
jgi:PEP-CTERM motif